MSEQDPNVPGSDPEQPEDLTGPQASPAGEFLAGDEVVIGQLGPEDLIAPDAPSPGLLGRTAIRMTGALFDWTLNSRSPAYQLSPYAADLHHWVVGRVTAHEGSRVIREARPRSHRAEQPRWRDRRYVAGAVEEALRGKAALYVETESWPKDRVHTNPHGVPPAAAEPELSYADDAGGEEDEDGHEDFPE